MQCIQAEFDETSKAITIKKDAETEDWVSVCRRFNDDVSRVCDVNVLMTKTINTGTWSKKTRHCTG
jgi:uncharacterized protein YqfB (UPF0267 family)